MNGLILLYLAAGGLIGCLAEVNISDYIYWKKKDIDQWHQFFPSRYLEEERQTVKAANDAVISLSLNLQDSLSKIISFQYRELDTAYQLMSGTPAEGCLNGISKVLDQAIEDETEAYRDCSADAQSKISRLNYNVARANYTYQTAYQRALAGIDICAKNYPNKDSIDRLRACIETINMNYFTLANNTQTLVFPSPSMAFFKDTVVECASTSAQAVAAKGAKFLNMLVNCASLSGTVDPTIYKEELSAWKGYNDTLFYQINSSQVYNYFYIQKVEAYMKNFYLLQKQALERNVIETRGEDYFYKELYLQLADYYNTVTSTSLDNPGVPECVLEAKASLDTIVNTSAYALVGCDAVIVRNTKMLVSEIYQTFLNLNNIIPSVGNVAVLDCISQGYIFAPDVIQRCVKLTSSQFEVDFSDAYDVISKDSTTLAYSISTFLNNSNLTCGNFTMKRVFLGADKVLFELQRCIYKTSGDIYEVTTPTQEYVTTISTPTQNTTQVSQNNTTTQYPIYNTTTEIYNTTTQYPPFNTTTQIYNSTTQYLPYNTTTKIHNTTTQYPPYNTTTKIHNTTTQYPPYNTTTKIYNTTTQYPPYNTTTKLHNTTTQYPPYNTTAHIYNSTTQYPQYNTTTKIFNTTTQYPPYSTTTQYNSTTQYVPYNTTTQMYNSTTKYPFYNTTTEIILYNTTTKSPLYKSTTPSPPYMTTKQTAPTRGAMRRTTTRRPRKHIPHTRRPAYFKPQYIEQY